VQSLHDSAANLGPAIVQNPIEVFEQPLGELLKSGQTLPPQLVDPPPQVVENAALIALVPSLSKLFLQQVSSVTRVTG
jgi:hypothetical protein